MTDWLKILGMIFYAPLRGMREARDHGALGPAVICAYLVQVAYAFLTLWLAGNRATFSQNAGPIADVLFRSVAPVLTIAVVIIPVTILIANLFDRRGSFAVVLQQEYGSLASVALYGLTAASIATLLIAVLFHFAGIQGSFISYVAQLPDSEEARQVWNVSAEELARRKVLFSNSVLISLALFEMVRWPLMAGAAILGLREVFRFSWLRSILLFVLVSFASFPLATILFPIFGRVIGSPFLLIFMFFLLRGYFSGVVSTQRARAAFKQNLEAATINPRDSSAHYNLGLIHQSRGELDQARERFQRAIDIDPDELDAHYQLGRIARTQNRLAEAIGHFEEVVQRDQFHAQHEIWREIGATYVAAGQFSDARDALQRFLDRRENDPQSLYLMGRAHAGLGDQREAASSMQACIEAVKTAPAYKYRTEKRWLHEAQQFLKGKKQETVGSRQ